nr:uncharacterized protein LOC129058189 isoform X3 [Pongo abelii]
METPPWSPAWATLTSQVPGDTGALQGLSTSLMQAPKFTMLRKTCGRQQEDSWGMGPHVPRILYFTPAAHLESLRGVTGAPPGPAGI